MTDQFERTKQYRARGCRGGAYRKGRIQRSASYNIRRDQERRSHLDASAQQENDPYRLNRHHTSYHHHHHRNYHHHNHRHRNQNYHGRQHPNYYMKKESSDAKSRTLSILPDGEEFHLGGDKPTYPSDDVVGTAAADKTDPSPKVLAPILLYKSSDSADAAPLAKSTEVSQTAVIAPVSKTVSKHAAKESGAAAIKKQAARNFSFFALSPSSFLTGKRTTNGHSFF